MNYEILKNILDNYETERFSSEKLLIEDILFLNNHELIELYFLKKIYIKEINESNINYIFTYIFKYISSNEITFLLLESKIFDSQFKMVDSFNIGFNIFYIKDFIECYNFKRNYICDISLEDFNSKLSNILSLNKKVSSGFYDQLKYSYEMYCNNPKLFFKYFDNYISFFPIEDNSILLINLKNVKSLSSNVKKQILQYVQYFLKTQLFVYILKISVNVFEDKGIFTNIHSKIIIN